MQVREIPGRRNNMCKGAEASRYIKKVTMNKHRKQNKVSKGQTVKALKAGLRNLNLILKAKVNY